MKCKNFEDARKQAKANAEYFNHPYIVFFDTSGNVHCEKYTTQIVDGKLFHPTIFPVPRKEHLDR